MHFARVWLATSLPFVALACSGCGGKPEPKPTPPAKPVDPVVEKASTAESTKPKPTVETPPSIQPKVETPPKTAVDDQLRSVVAKLARKEGTKWKVDEQAKEKLEELGPNAVNALLPMFEDQSADVRRGAAYHLLPFAVSRDDLAQAYIGLLDDDDATIRGIALGAVGQVKPAQRVTAAANLAKVLASTTDDEQHRATAARLLGDVGKQAQPLLPQLSAAASSDASPKVRSASLLAISRVAEPAAAVKIFVQALGDQEATVRLVALQRLRELGRDAAPASEELARLLEDKDEKTRKTAAEALVRIGSQSVPLLATRLESKSRDAREIAIIALAKMGPLAKPALPALKKRLADSDAKVKEQAKIAILEIESQ